MALVNLREYICAIFSSASCASFARWATASTVATGCWAMVHLVRANHALPEPMQLAALSVWMVAPYSINKAAAVFTGKPDAA